MNRLLRRLRQFLSKSPELLMNRQSRYARYAIGDWTYGRPTILDWNDGAVFSIGKYCSIARDVTILVGGEHHLEWVTTYPFSEMWHDLTPHVSSASRSKGDVRIENDVWIGTRSTVLSGVSIANGAVVGAGSVVTKSVPPYAIVAGNPARLIRFRFDQSLIENLQRIAWWTWPREKLIRELPFLLTPNVTAFAERHESHSASK